MKKIAILMVLMMGLLALAGCSSDNTSKMVSHVLTMNVDNANSEEVEEATVTVFQDGEELFDETGYGVQFPLKDGTYTVKAEAEGYVSESKEVVISGEDVMDTITLTEEAYPLTVTVKDDSGNSVENAEVTVGSDNVITDASGQAVINLRDGNYTVEANAIGYNGSSKDVTIDGIAKSISIEVSVAAKSYFYSSVDGSKDISTSIDPLIDFWGSKTTISVVSQDSYNNVYKSVSTEGWGNVLVFTQFDAGKLENYDKLVFKFKSDQYTKLSIKVPDPDTADGADIENEYVIADNAIDLGNGWYEVEVDLSDFSAALDSAVEFAFLNYSNGTRYLTDIYVY